MCYVFFFSSRRRHTRFDCDWSSDVCSSDLSSQFDAREFEGLHRYLRDSFPKSHAALKLTRVNGYGLLYEWTGSDPRSEEHTSELQSQSNLACRLLLAKNNPDRAS